MSQTLNQDLCMQIRSLIDLDIPQVHAIEQLVQPSPWSEAAFKRCWEANYPGWVAEIDDKIIAFVIVTLTAGECHILNLCVHPDYQRQGFGEKLLLDTLGWARGQGGGIAYLEVRKSNSKAINLYRKMNFKMIGERKNYYPEKEDAFVFAIDIGSIQL